MTRNAILAAIVGALLCSGCTMMVRTNPVPHSMGTRVPSDRLLAFTEKKDGYASVVVTRDEGFMYGGCYVGLVISGTLAARFDPKETAELFVPPGDSDMAIVPDPHGKGLCSAGGWDPVPEHYQLKADRPNLFRISFGAYRRPRLLPTVY